MGCSPAARPGQGGGPGAGALLLGALTVSTLSSQLGHPVRKAQSELATLWVYPTRLGLQQFSPVPCTPRRVPWGPEDPGKSPTGCEGFLRWGQCPPPEKPVVTFLPHYRQGPLWPARVWRPVQAAHSKTKSAVLRWQPGNEGWCHQQT